MKIGILALQGCVDAHKAHLLACGVTPIEVRNQKDFAEISGLIIPGGESTTQLKLLKILNLEKTFQETAQKIPYWGVCAGSILMAKNVSNPEQKSFGLIDVDVERNSYGRQLESFTAEIDGYTVAFIRAPRFTSLGSSVRATASFDDSVVAAEIPNSHRVSAFHAELNPNTPSPFHKSFVALCRQKNIEKSDFSAEIAGP